MKQIKLFVHLMSVAAIFAAITMADTVPFQWSTTGSFSSPGLPSGLSFTGASVSAVTNTAADGTLFGVDLGQFTFANITTDYTGTFSLTVNFFRPDGSTDPAYSATLVADANTNGGNDQLTITFPSASQFGFSGLDGTGTFTFGVENVSDFRNGSHTDTVNLLGDITGAVFTRGDVTTSAVPEPSSILLLCTALGGLAFMAKRKLSLK